MITLEAKLTTLATQYKNIPNLREHLDYQAEDVIKETFAWYQIAKRYKYRMLYRRLKYEKDK